MKGAMKNSGESESGHTALYRKYRSRTLDEIVSQSQVTNILKRSLKQGKIAHAYLLTGPKGVGKTSIARILAHEINHLPYDGEETHLDIIEIDAASNNGVDNVRDLRDKANLAPTSAAKKVYIIDEVHMLSKPAFNALLKTLEEPPSHVVFILATTDLHKVPATIISRTQHFSLHAVSQQDLAAHLKKIAKGEGITISDEAVAAIAARGDGSFRNSISLLDQLSGFADEKEGVTLELVETTLGLASEAAVKGILSAISQHDAPSVVAQLDEIEKQGVQPTVFADQLITTIRGRLANQPQLVSLLDALLDVQQSPQPGLKLLATLVGAIKPKTAATPVKMPTAILEAPVVIIEKPVETETTTAPKEDTDKVEQPTKPAATRKKSGAVKDLDWQAVIDYTRENLVALHSVLSKCTYKLEGDTLTLYAGRKFNKTKLDEVKYQTQLNQALAHVGVEGVYILTLPNVEPPADENLARIAEMMGGGHEIVLNEAGEPA